MRRPQQHPMEPDSPIVECPHCSKRYPAEDGPVCVRCGGRLSKYNTNAVDILVDIDEEPHEAVKRHIEKSRETQDEDWPHKTVITFE